MLRIDGTLPGVKIPGVGVLTLGKFLIVFLAGDLCPMFGGSLLEDLLLQLRLEDSLKVCPRLGGQGLECLPGIGLLEGGHAGWMKARVFGWPRLLEKVQKQ